MSRIWQPSLMTNALAMAYPSVSEDCTPCWCSSGGLATPHARHAIRASLCPVWRTHRATTRQRPRTTRRHQFCRVFPHDADSRACCKFPTNLGYHKMKVLYDLDSTTADLARDVLILAGWALVPTGQIDCLLAQL